MIKHFAFPLDHQQFRIALCLKTTNINSSPQVLVAECVQLTPHHISWALLAQWPPLLWFQLRLTQSPSLTIISTSVGCSLWASRFPYTSSLTWFHQTLWEVIVLFVDINDFWAVNMCLQLHEGYWFVYSEKQAFWASLAISTKKNKRKRKLHFNTNYLLVQSQRF